MVTTVQATLDRIVDGEHAVLLVEGEEGVTDEIVVDVDEIPEDGRSDGAIFEVTVSNTQLQEITHLSDETQSRIAGAQDRLDRLSSSLSDSSRNDE